MTLENCELERRRDFRGGPYLSRVGVRDLERYDLG